MNTRGWWANRWVWLCSGILLVGALGYAWLEKQTLLAWYHVRQVAQSEPDACASHVEALRNLGIEAARALVAELGSRDQRSRENCGRVLAQLSGEWGVDSPRGEYLAARLAREFKSLPAEGHPLAIRALTEALLQKEAATPTEAWFRSASAILTDVGTASDPDGKSAALQLINHFINQNAKLPEEFKDSCRAVIRGALQERELLDRRVAVRLAASQQMSLHRDLIPLLVGTAVDPSPEVRCLALAAIGTQEELLATDDLLPLLHDTDPEVRTICEQALKSRGLTPSHVHLARLISHPQPAVRARVPAEVQLFPDLDSRMWLSRLGKDPSPAVRAAAARAAWESSDLQLQDWVRDLSRSDPSPTVRQIADYYAGRSPVLPH